MNASCELTKDQKQAIGLLSVGTFLEYFDLMLYVHMAVILNDLFFPKTDPYTASVLSAFAFCSTYLLRPFGALLFGYIGDNYGRKITVIITTIMMASSCFVMANLPTYDQIGLTATIAMIICRMVQGVSSMGEIMGAELYVTEITSPPQSYLAVGFVSMCSLFGGVAALAFGMVCTSLLINWRLAFWGGVCIALVGAVARTTLRETPEFIDAKRRMRKSIEDTQDDDLINQGKKTARNTNALFGEKVNWKTSLSYFCIVASWPALFYLVYVYFADLLKHNYKYTGADILQNNLIVTIFNLGILAFVILLSKYFHPLKILKVRAILFLMFMLFCPYLLYQASSPTHIFLIQLLFVATGLGRSPAGPIIYKAFPVFKRFTYASFLYSLSRIIVYIVTSFGMIYLIKTFGYYGILVVMMPVGISFYLSVKYFESFENTNL